MLRTLLGASNVSIDSLILDILIILGVVVAGALVVYFLWEGVSAIVNKSKKGGSEIKEPNFGKKEEAVEDFSLDAQPVKEEPVKEEEVVAQPVVAESLLDESKLTEVDEAKAEEEKTQAENEMSEQERLNAERRAYLEARRQELIRRMQEEMNNSEDEEEEAEEQETEEEPVSEQQAEEVSDEVETEEAEEVAIPDPEPIEEAQAVEEVEEEPQVDALEEEKKALIEEREKYAAMVKELEQAKQELAEAKAEIKAEQEAVPAPVITNGVLSLDELKERLADAEERLKATDKEFKQCKKEYIPLRKVWNTHEKDERKLRRKEALVAKQKVILYGVNNYADIDEEKAKKLAEDLDLLDGLKLSVQHCEEVMKKNAERYPLLEKMYNVLKERNDELKNDIAYYKEEIAKLENADDTSETETQE